MKDVDEKKKQKEKPQKDPFKIRLGRWAGGKVLPASSFGIVKENINKTWSGAKSAMSAETIDKETAKGAFQSIPREEGRRLFIEVYGNKIVDKTDDDYLDSLESRSHIISIIALLTFVIFLLALFFVGGFFTFIILIFSLAFIVMAVKEDFTLWQLRERRIGRLSDWAKERF